MVKRFRCQQRLTHRGPATRSGAASLAASLLLAGLTSLLSALLLFPTPAGLADRRGLNRWAERHPPERSATAPAAASVLPPEPGNPGGIREALAETVRSLDTEFAQAWHDAGVQPARLASPLTLARRLSLALTGTVPSLEEIRSLEKLPADEVTQVWLSRLFQDRRSSDYLAGRIARATVGTEDGPFLIYRRHRMVEWISDQLHERRPYDELVRRLIDAHGIWTTQPEVNFITVTVDQNDKSKGPDEEKLARRVARAFLGVRVDCAQCHDDFVGNRWKQQDFHQLAAFFAPAELALTGVRDNEKLKHRTRYHHEKSEHNVAPAVPFEPALLPASGSPRARLAAWVTHPENRAFARTTVNRVWALLFDRPLEEPIDDIPLQGPYPAGLELLADDLVGHHFDLQRLIRVIAASRPFQTDSSAAAGEAPVTEAQEKHWAAFPITRLRPEQVAGAVIQSSTLQTIDASAHVLVRVARHFQQIDFIKRYGDAGEDEFNQNGRGGTIPQRLLFLNGQLVLERTGERSLLGTPARIALLAPDDATAVDVAYLCALTRHPLTQERDYFLHRLQGTRGPDRQRAVSDLAWTLLNATEFSWNH